MARWPTGSSATAVYLVIGHEDDACCREVAALLRARRARVVVTPEPLAGETTFSWSLGAERSSSSLRLADGTVVEREALAGVLVWAQGGPYDAEGWESPTWATRGRRWWRRWSRGCGNCPARWPTG
ncbi:MAG TPA: hypothetical protein VFL91_16445 [Thermomicrobiales bacterium]|nr:hypothetical protein [Thermomicrobiales bacterium]